MLKNKSNQTDTGMSFDGLSNGSSQRATAPKIQVNQYTGHMNDGRDVQMRQMPNRTGNQSDLANNTMGHAPQSSRGGKTRFANPDMINVGNGPRNAGGTRNFMPSAGQNYKGNPDMIQNTQMPNRKGNDGC